MRAMAIAVASLLALQGCAGDVGTYANNGVVNQTIPISVAGTRLAALRTLKRLGVTVEKDERSGDGWTILAKTVSRMIDIDLEALSDKSVRMRVEVDWFVFIKDTSEAIDIIDMTNTEMSHLTFKQIRIATAQMLLSDIGYDTTIADGILDTKTRNAILRFQRNTDIRADGKVSAQLITMLRNSHRGRSAAVKIHLTNNQI